MAIELRTNKASALTYNEMDRNFSSFFYSASVDNGNILKLWYTGSTTLNTGGEDFGPARFIPIDLQPTTGAVPTLTVAGDPRAIQFRHSTNPVLDADNGFLYNTALQLGIGASIPAANAKIHARGTNTVPATLRLESTTNIGTNRRATVDFYQGTVLYGTIGRHDPFDPNMYIKSWAPTGKFAIDSDPGHIRFVVGNNANYGAFTQAGFGIGTFLPQHTFHAEGNGYFAGNIGIGVYPGAAKVTVYQIDQLQSSAGDFKHLVSLSNIPISSVNALHTSIVRTSAGADWTTSGMRIQQQVDSEYMGYLQFSGDNNNYGITMGTGTSGPGGSILAPIEAFRITQPSQTAAGKVGINTKTPNAQLDVNGDTIVTGSFTTTGNATIKGTATIDYSLTTGTTVAVGTNLTVTGTATIGNIPAGTAGAGTKILTANNAGQIQYITGTFPLGGIVMWAGSPTALPTGWALCDGTGTWGVANPIPDLRERFIVGAGGDNLDVKTYNYNTLTINSSILLSSGNAYVSATFTKVNDTSMVTGNGTTTANIYTSINEGSGQATDYTRQYALYSFVGNSATTSYFLVYHQPLKTYVLYRGYVPASGTSIASTTAYPYYILPPGSVAVLSQTGDIITHRPSANMLEWVANTSGYSVGDRGGFNDITLHTSEMPSHNHGFTRSWRDNGDYGRGLETGDSELGTQDFPAPPNEGNIHFRGGNLPHENRPPYYALAFIIYTGA